MAQDRKARPKNSKPTANVWAVHDENEPDDGGEDIVTPSGQTCRVMISVGIRGLVEMGVLESMDSLSAIVESEVVAPRQGKMTPAQAKKAIAKKAGAGVTPGDREAAQALMKDPSKLTEMMDMMDAVVVAVVMEPKVYPVPKADDDGNRPPRVAGRVYVDRVQDADKMFIFNHAVAGVRNLEQFRSEVGELVEGLDVGEEVAHPA